ncbi:hypothetical protein J2P12_02620, partial [Candidatus Bathyarchaeota archaeon]|nr:hypothetical protein [Candidatus Bathyarchaeota archaeon]
MGKDGKTTLLTGIDSDRTSLQLNMWIDTAYHLPTANKPGYLQSLNEVIQKEHVEAVFPQPDPEVKRISDDREKLRAKLFLPDTGTVNTCLDKFEALSIWHKRRLRKEPMILSASDPSAEKKMGALQYPCWIRAREGAGGLLSCRAPDKKIAGHWLRFHWDQGIKTDFVAEEYLPGRDYCFMSIWNNGSLLTSMIRERLSWVGHRLIGTGGTSKLNRTVHDANVNDRAQDAIRAISKTPHGIFCVDLKEDQDSVPSPTEINCRFTTNVHYLTLASIKLAHPEWNFPWLASRLALG